MSTTLAKDLQAPAALYGVHIMFDSQDAARAIPPIDVPMLEIAKTG